MANTTLKKKKVRLSSLTAPQKRVAIAKDVIKHLNLTQVTNGEYFKGTVSPGEGKEASEILPQLVEKCRVCALGACLLSHIRLFNRVPIEQLMTFPDKDFMGRGAIIFDKGFQSTTEWMKYFPRLQCCMIEAAFEGQCINGDRSSPLMYKAVNFGSRWIDPKERLRAIMKNIIKNKGTFKP